VSFTRGGTVCEHLTVANTHLRRMRGLLGRRSLPAGEGLLLRPERGIHTAFMRFTIDALFLDEDMQVIEIAAQLRPWRLAAARGANAVLELAAGEAASRGVRVGDRLGVLDQAELEPSHDGNGDGDGEAPPWNFPPDSELVLPPPAVANGVHPMRVLLVAHDRRFRTVASALLARRGCAVTTSMTATRVAPLVERDRIEVVVLDCGGLLTDAARTVAAIGELNPAVGVVLVADEAEAGLHHLPVLAKWGPFEDVYAAIERAERDRGRRSRLVG
jgi:uncharacterized membrane protein (UPF0127 family)/CheY-like chemotaxis protein